MAMAMVGNGGPRIDTRYVGARIRAAAMAGRRLTGGGSYNGCSCSEMLKVTNCQNGTVAVPCGKDPYKDGILKNEPGSIVIDPPIHILL